MKIKKFSLNLVAGLLILLLFASNSIADKESQPILTGSVNVSNDFINIFVFPTGGFTMGTTGGDPGTTADNNQRLLYGYPGTYTSHMTVRIDGTDYYTRNSGLDAYWISGPTASGSSIITTWRIGDIGVTQTVSMTTSSTTGRQDTALFRVALTNNGNTSHTVGARFMFDTMLGSNDAAPFRIPVIGDVTTEREFNGSSVPSYWQAFDSLSNPTVISQGTLATSPPPDRFMMVGWSNIVGYPWDYSVRTGYSNGDSATAVYWNPVIMQPGMNAEYSTAYGLGGVTITTQGALSLGMTSPINATAGDNFTITAYLQNTGSAPIDGIAASLSLPAGIGLASGEASGKTIGTLAAGASTQVSWNVSAQGTGSQIYYISVTSSNAATATGNRTVYISPSSTAQEDAEKVFQAGDIDNLGFGWPAGFNVFSGASTPAHSYPYQPDPADPNGTDRIMVGTGYNGNPPAGSDGYTGTTSRPSNLPQAIEMRYNLAGTQVNSASIQMFVDDFQSPVFRSRFQVTLNGQRAIFLEDVLNSLDQTGPIGKLITVQVPSEFLPVVGSGHLTIYIDDPTTGAGDGYAVDFVRLLVNPHISTVGNITGRVIDYVTNQPIQGATVSASGIVTATTGIDGTYTLRNVPAGLAVVTASKNGYDSQSLTVDLVAGTQATLNFGLRQVTPAPTSTPVPSGVIGQWASSAAASSEYSSTSWSADQATGAPDTAGYGDIATAWASANSEDGIQWIELNYDYFVYATGVNVHETFNPGSLIRVELKDNLGTYHTVWTGTDPNTGTPDDPGTGTAGRSGWSNLTFAQTAYPAKTVKLYLDTNLVPGWNEVDAVELTGLYADVAAPTPTPTTSAYWLSANPSIVSQGDSITVTFSAPGYQTDWIAIYPINAENTAYGEWYYLEGRTSGTLSFTAPSTPGTYEFRMFQNYPDGGYNDIARSNRITVSDVVPTPTVTGTPVPVTSNVNISNRYIDVVVNPTGDYTMATTGGDPAIRTDDNQLLLYGYPSTFTSYLTVRIDGTDYYKSILEGYRVSGPRISGNSIITAWRIGDMTVTESILITTSSTTGREDTALFEVSFRNNGNTAHSAGARFLFDTKLGTNDYAPFRVPGMGDVTTEQDFNGSNVPTYWQAFDSLTNPSVVSQGTLATSTPPNRFIMANWRNLYNNPWDYSILRGSSNGDSATAVYWQPISIEPARTVEYSTAYGLGGVTVVSDTGTLSLGITSPTNVESQDAFTVTAYIQNTGATPVNDLVGSISLPQGLSLVPGETAQKSIGTLAAGNNTQVSWNVQATGTGTINFSISVSASNAVSKSANRTINVAPGRTSNSTVIRTISSSAVQPEAIFNVTLTPSPSSSFDSPGFQATEVIPLGFTFVGTEAGVIHIGNLYTFTQLGSSAIIYTLRAPATSGSYSISGTFKDELRNTGTISGAMNINVGGSGGDLLTRYDADHDGRIGRSEAIQAVMDYFSNLLTRQDAINVVTLYFTG